MPRLGATISQLAKLRAAPLGPSLPGSGSDHLHELAGFGSNPGALLAKYYVPQLPADRGAKAMPLVVVLHGCTQDPGGYDRGAGWSQLADELGFVLLFPEQQRLNNPNLCFNWFSPADSHRDRGEAHSIRQMIAAIVDANPIDEQRIFVTGLSAGGAMASIMLAAYPELFAGGAIIAGLPFGAADSVGDAFARMRGDGYPSDDRLGDLVREASDHDGPWPTISVWQGTADTTVDPSNADHIIAQWRSVHNVQNVAPDRATIDGSQRLTWHDATGRTVVESYTIAGMGHGTPLATRGPDGYGKAGPYMLEVGISSTRHIAEAWGLDADAATQKPAEHRQPTAKSPSPATITHMPPAPAKSRPSTGISAVIEDALRKAGLVR